MLFLENCIVADPPEYRDPTRTRPLLDVYKAVPRTQEVLVADTTVLATIQFSVPVRSEDAGEDLMALFFIDYGVSGLAARRLNGQLIPASTYDDTSRSARFPWQPRALLPGCHLLTLVVAHQSTFKNGDLDQLDPAKASDDAAIVTWWVNVDPKIDETHTLLNCPISVTPVQMKRWLITVAGVSLLAACSVAPVKQAESGIARNECSSSADCRGGGV